MEFGDAMGGGEFTSLEGRAQFKIFFAIYIGGGQ
jgi:hypothetical protein